VYCTCLHATKACYLCGNTVQQVTHELSYTLLVYSVNYHTWSGESNSWATYLAELNPFMHPNHVILWQFIWVEAGFNNADTGNVFAQGCTCIAIRKIMVYKDSKEYSDQDLKKYGLGQISMINVDNEGIPTWKSELYTVCSEFLCSVTFFFFINVQTPVSRFMYILPIYF
jgi:hypothetical protein